MENIDKNLVFIWLERLVNNIETELNQLKKFKDMVELYGIDFLTSIIKQMEKERDSNSE